LAGSNGLLCNELFFTAKGYLFFNEIMKNLFVLWKTRKHFTVNTIIIALIVVCALGLRLFFYVGMGPRDDIAYVGAAHALQTHSFQLPPPHSSNIFSVRMMMYLPIFLSWKLFGISEFATCLYFLLCSVLLIATGYCIATILYGSIEAIIVAVLLCLIPLDIVFSSQIMPDLPQSVLGSNAFLFLLLGMKQQNKLCFIVSGIMVALAVMTKEFALIYYVILIFFIVHLVIYRELKPVQALSLYTLIIVSSIVVLFFFWLPYLIESIPWAPIKVILNNANAEKNANPDNWYYLKLMFNLYEHTASTRYFGILYYLCALALLCIGLKDFRRSGPLVYWILFYIFFIQWFGPWLAGRATCERMERFLIPMSLPAGLIIARTLGMAWRMSRISRIAVVIILTLVAYSMLRTTILFAYPSESIHLWDLKRVAHILPKLTDSPFYADRGSAHKLRFLTSYRLDIREYDPEQRNFDTLSKCWIAFDVSDEGYLRKWIRERRIPDDWIEIFRMRGPKVSHFGSFDAKVYWAP
jgi:4-amino-4-deoxy-L-arabinose transferase-like glycosyltransferase